MEDTNEIFSFPNLVPVSVHKVFSLMPLSCCVAYIMPRIAGIL